jgi:microcystin-dependent protein
MQHNDCETKKKNIELITYQKQSVNVLRFITNKFLYVFADESLQKWGFRNREPWANIDVTGNVNVSDDYYINRNLLMPVGMIVPFAGTVVPNNWLSCDGSSYRASQYNRLYGVIGTSYGGISGNFNVPNLSGRVPIGTTGDYAITSTGGSTTHTLTENQMPSHTHTNTHNANGGNQGLAYKGDGNTPGSIDSGGNEINCTNTRGLALTINNTGGGQPFNIMQPYLVVNYIIRY